MDLKNRLLEYIKFKGLSISQFERICGLSNGFVDKTGENTRRSTLDKISNKFTDLNIDWLRTGKGSMLNPVHITHKVNDSNIVEVGGSVFGNVDNKNEHHYSGHSIEDMINMLEKRFQHLLKKDEEIRYIFEENRKLTEEVIRQNADLRMYNESYRRQVERIAELTEKLLESK